MRDVAQLIELGTRAFAALATEADWDDLIVRALAVMDTSAGQLALRCGLGVTIGVYS